MEDGYPTILSYWPSVSMLTHTYPHEPLRKIEGNHTQSPV